MHISRYVLSLHWRHNDHDGVSHHHPNGCLLNRLFRRRSKKTSKLRVTGLCVGNSPGPVNSPHKGPVTRKMFPFDDVIMYTVRPTVPRMDMMVSVPILACNHVPLQRPPLTTTRYPRKKMSENSSHDFRPWMMTSPNVVVLRACRVISVCVLLLVYTTLPFASFKMYSSGVAVDVNK